MRHSGSTLLKSAKPEQAPLAWRGPHPATRLQVYRAARDFPRQFLAPVLESIAFPARRSAPFPNPPPPVLRVCRPPRQERNASHGHRQRKTADRSGQTNRKPAPKRASGPAGIRYGRRRTKETPRRAFSGDRGKRLVPRHRRVVQTARGERGRKGVRCGRHDDLAPHEGHGRRQTVFRGVHRLGGNRAETSDGRNDPDARHGV